MSPTAVGMSSDEIRLLGQLFSLVVDLGYDAEKKYVLESGRSIKYEKVLPVKNATYRLVVYEVNSSIGSHATTFSLTFDPVSKEGLVFGKFLEQVVVKLVAVKKVKVELRECVMEISCKDPMSRLRSNQYYILNTNRSSGWSESGKMWLSDDMQLTVGQALVIAELLKTAVST